MAPEHIAGDVASFSSGDRVLGSQPEPVVASSPCSSIADAMAY
jgi:hypothetical protein